ATEDRVVGTLDLEGALLEGRSRLRPGLLAAADGGVLYVDEVNLLADQLVDRFGLAVEVRAPRDPQLRTEVVRRRLAYDADPAAFAGRFAAEEDGLRAAIGDAAAIAGEVVVPDEVLALASRLCAELDAEGLRADLVLARGSAALAALDGRKEATADDVVRLSPLALAHRRRRGPLDAPGLDPQELEEALGRADAGEGDGAGSEGEAAPDPGGRGEAGGPQDPRPPAPGVFLALSTQRPSGVLGRRNRGPASRGGIVAARPSPTGV